jgi:hypothetical protein
MGPMREVVAERLCLLYDPNTGDIRHLHSVTTLLGGRTLTDAEMEARTRELAATRSAELAALPLLHVDPASWRSGARYRVAPASRTLVER